MAVDWNDFFRREREVRRCAERAGIPKLRAAAIAERMASKGLSRAEREALLDAVASNPRMRHLAGPAARIAGNNCAPTCCCPLCDVEMRRAMDVAVAGTATGDYRAYAEWLSAQRARHALRAAMADQTEIEKGV